MKTPTEILAGAERNIKGAAMNDPYVLKCLALSAIADALAEGRQAMREEAANIAMTYMENADEEQFTTAEAIACEIRALWCR